MYALNPVSPMLEESLDLKDMNNQEVEKTALREAS
jgi:hypothetical protein